VTHLSNRPVASLLPLAILLLSSLFLVPGTVAQAATDWTEQSLGLTDSASELHLAVDGERVGLTYHFSTAPNRWGFSIRSAGDAGTWVQKSGDLTTGNVLDPFNSAQIAGANIVRCLPFHVSGTIWLAACVAQSSIGAHNTHMLRSTDDGVTWARVATLGATPSQNGISFATLGSYIGYTVPGISNTDLLERVYLSGDAGATWPTIYTISDNKGAPTGTATASVQGGVGNLLSGFLAGWMTGQRIYQADSQDASFWHVPFTNTANCNLDDYCGPPGNSGYCLLKDCAPGVDSGTVQMPVFDSQSVTASSSKLSLVYGGVWLWQDGATGAIVQGNPNTNTAAAIYPTCTTPASPGLTRVGADGNGATVIAVQQCNAPVAFNVFQKVGSGSWTLSKSLASVSSVDHDVRMTATKTYVAFTDSTIGGQVKVMWAKTPSLFLAIASTSVTNLVGFDVDPFNQVVIARTDVGSGTSKIRTFDASSPVLTQRGASPLSTDCNAGDGVMAYSTSANGKQYAGFVDCDDDNIVTNFGIRGGDLNAPDQSGTNCEDFIPVPGCSYNLDGHLSNACQGYALPDGPSLQMGNIAAIPIGFEGGGGELTPHVQVGFAYSNQANGNIGTWTSRQQGLGGNEFSTCREEVPFSTPGNTYQICSWRNRIDDKDYIAAVGPSNPTRVWQFTIDPFSINSGVKTRLTPVAAGLSAPFDHLRAIACIDNDALVMQEGTGQVSRVHVIGNGIGGVVWGPIDAPDGILPQRGVAVSRDGKWAAMVSETTVAVLNFTDGSVLDSFASPSDGPTDAFKEIRVSSAGQKLWLAYKHSITEYDVHSITTGVSVAEGTEEDGDGNQICRNGRNQIIPCVGGPIPPGGGQPSFLGGANCGLSFLFGDSVAMNAVGCGFLFVVIPFASVGAGVAGRIGAGIGGGVGAIMVIAGGSLPKELVFLLVLGAVILAAIRWGSGDE
jgi:hypothetical protein